MRAAGCGKDFGVEDPLGASELTLRPWLMFVLSARPRLRYGQGVSIHRPHKVVTCSRCEAAAIFEEADTQCRFILASLLLGCFGIVWFQSRGRAVGK